MLSIISCIDVVSFIDAMLLCRIHVWCGLRAFRGGCGGFWLLMRFLSGRLG